MNTEGNYCRVILEFAWGYDKELLNSMSDEDCENEYDVLGSTIDYI